MKYINADKLIAEIRQHIHDPERCEDWRYRIKMEEDNALLERIINIITSLQQGQPDVELDKEIIRYKVPFSDDKEYLNETTLDSIARHFAEWGAIHLNAGKEE